MSVRLTWQTFDGAGQNVEAQLWQSTTAPQATRLVLFCPGFPGAGAGHFEQRHAAALAHSGADILVIKHAGTRLDTPFAPAVVNNAQRLFEGRKHGHTHLGGGPSTAAQWLREPLIVLQALAHRYARIDMIGNSFGAVSALWSLCQPQAPLDRVGTLLLYAGAQGVDDGNPVIGIMRVWHPMLLANPMIAERVSLDPPQAIHDTMQAAYAEIAAKAPYLPHSISVTSLVVAADEILKRSDAEAFHALLGRGQIVDDTLDRAYPTANLLAHDTPDYTTEKLMELLS